MFYIIGIGLGDAKDITVKGLEIVKKCSRVYLESYTSILSCGQKSLEEFYGRELILADRELVEQYADTILLNAAETDIALLVVGDPFGATTHTDLLLRAKEKQIPYKVVHNASIMNAVGCCGLQLYNFGETISIPFWDDNWKPDSFYEKIKKNRLNDMHTLCLLDIKVKEPTMESLMKRKKEYMPPRFMTVRQAAAQLLQIINEKEKEIDDLKDLAFSKKCNCIGLARIGHDTQEIVVRCLEDLVHIDMGAPLHSLVIPCRNLHPLELEYLQQFCDKKLEMEDFL